MKKLKVYYQENLEIKTTILNYEELKYFKHNIIRTKEQYDVYKYIQKDFVSKQEVLNLFYQFKIILSANIEFIDALDIILKNEKNSKLKKMLLDIKSSMKSGFSLYEVTNKYIDILGIEAIEFLRLSHNRVDLKIVIDSIYKLLKKKYETRKIFISKLRYPIIVLLTLLVSLVMIFSIVIPKFETLFVQYAVELPYSTKLLLETKEFISSYSLFILAFLICIYFVFKKLYKSFTKLAFLFDKFLTKLPVFGTLILTYELYKFFISLNILLRAKFDFDESFNNAIVLLNNKYILDRMSRINLKMRAGSEITSSFKSVDLFDDIVISLINTGERSASLNTTVYQIVKIYKEKFNKSIKDFSSLIEPIFFIGIMLLILWVVLSIFIPIWDMQEVIKI